MAGKSSDIIGKEEKEIRVSVEEMRRYDAYTIEHFVPGRILMQRAAQGVFDSVEWKDRKTAIICGSGNNGGDGYALAGIMKQNGLDPVIIRVSEKCSEDGGYYLEKAEEAGVTVIYFREDTDLSGYEILVDCLLGTGFRGTPRGSIKTAIEKINASSAYIISVDINSGMNGDTGESELAVRSDLTVSIGFLKTGMFLGNATQLIGKLVNVDIGIVIPDTEDGYSSPPAK